MASPISHPSPTHLDSTNSFQVTINRTKKHCASEPFSEEMQKLIAKDLKTARNKKHKHRGYTGVTKIKIKPFESVRRVHDPKHQELVNELEIQEIETLMRQMSEMMEQMKDTQEQMADMKKQVRDTKEQMTEMKDQMESMEFEITLMRGRMETMEQCHDFANDRIETVEHDSYDIMMANQQLQIAVADLQNDAEDYEGGCIPMAEGAFLPREIDTLMQVDDGEAAMATPPVN